MIRQLLCHFVVGLLLVTGCAKVEAGSGANTDDGFCSNPTVNKPASGQGAPGGGDDPGGRVSWFLNTRKEPPLTGLSGSQQPQPPARRLLQSFQQVRRISEQPGLSEAVSAPWTSLGPSPQRSLYWGNVSGRVTSLALDTRDQKTLYVGTALGGLWMTTDYTAANPTYISLSDRDWPSLAVGSITLDTTTDPTQPPVIYVGTGEANNSLDSYYGIGILKSSDQGQTWYLSTGKTLATIKSGAWEADGPFVGSSVSKILIDPADSKHLLAAVSNSWLASGKFANTAIYESKNSGIEWNPMQLAEDQAFNAYNCTDLVLAPGQGGAPGVFYASIAGRGIYRLAAGDTAWKSTKSPFSRGKIAVNGTNFYRGSLTARSIGGQTTVYAIISAGSYDTAVQADPRSYNLSRPNPKKDTGVVQSTDGGQHWTAVAAPDSIFVGGAGNQGFYDQWITAPANTTSLLTGGIDIWNAATAGAAWTNATRSYAWGDALANPGQHIHSDQHAVIVLDAGNWIVGNDGGVYRTSDGGANWTSLNTNIGTIQFMSVTPLNGAVATGYFGGTQDNGTSGIAPGQSGIPWSTMLTGDGGYTSGNPGNSSQLFTERFFVELCRSDDGGQSWSSVVDARKIPSSEAAFYTAYKLVHSDPTRGNRDEIILGTARIWLGAAVPAISGDGWTPISQFLTSDRIHAIAAAPSAPQSVYVASGDGVVWFNSDIHSPNVVQQWLKMSGGLPAGRAIASLAVAPDNPQQVYAGVQGFGTGHVFRTDNGGASWADLTPKDVDGVAMDIPVNAILVDSANPTDVYVASDIGVFVSTDRGASWQPFGIGLPRVAVLDLKMSTDRHVVIATHGRGAWSIPAWPHDASAGGTSGGATLNPGRLQ